MCVAAWAYLEAPGGGCWGAGPLCVFPPWVGLETLGAGCWRAGPLCVLPRVWTWKLLEWKGREQYLCVWPPVGKGGGSGRRLLVSMTPCALPCRHGTLTQAP